VSAPVRVPLLDLKTQYETIRAEIRFVIERVLDSQNFILGPEVAGLEREIAEYSQCKFGIGVSSGTDALLVALMAIGVKPGDEVITTAYTFFATAGVISRLGAVPVFADIEADTFNIDPNKIESKISSRTRAVIPVHLFGRMARMDAIVEIANRHGIRVIEDAAQAVGAEYQGRRAGSIGDLGCFSFYPTKNLGAFGDAGMVTTNDVALNERVRMLRVHGYRTKYHNQAIGGNFRLDEMQAAILRVKLKYLDRWTEARRRNVGLYRDLLPEEVLAPADDPRGRHIYNQFVIRSKDRDRLMDWMKDHSIGSEIYYPVPLHLQECFSPLGGKPGDLPETERACSETLALPIYPELTDEMIGYVAATIRKFVSRF
jgi:dTDP-4-amino-4,6-dideoxygalactose transaminase